MDREANVSQSDFLSRAKAIAVSDQQQLGRLRQNGEQFPVAKLAAFEGSNGPQDRFGETCWLSAAVAVTLHEAGAAVENFYCARSGEEEE